MSVVAWDGKIIAADSRMLSLGHPTTVKKLRVVTDPKGTTYAIAGCGKMFDLELFIEWVASGMPRDPRPTVTDSFNGFVWVAGAPRPLLYESAGPGQEIAEPFHAIGSGRDFALASMHFQYGAVGAVATACRFDVSCAPPIVIATPSAGGFTLTTADGLDGW